MSSIDMLCSALTVVPSTLPLRYSLMRRDDVDRFGLEDLKAERRKAGACITATAFPAASLEPHSPDCLS